MFFATASAVKYTLVISLALIAAWYFSMPSLATVRASNSASKPAFSPTAVFVGGTSGIGEHIAYKIANYTKSPHIIISGRNKAAADTIVQEMKKLNPQPGSNFEFVPIDATLMKSVKAYAAEIRERVNKLNYLVLSPGFLSMSGRDETPEGLDKKLACNYYARFLLISELLPLLQKAKEQGEDARVLSVLAAGKGGSIDLNDLDLKNNYGLKTAADSATTYNDIMVEEFSARYPAISFIHAYPGFVSTGILRSLPWYARVPAKALLPFATSPEDCAEYMVHSLFSKEQESGWWMMNEKADKEPRNKYATDEARKKVWEHTEALIQEALAKADSSTNTANNNNNNNKA